MTLNVTLPPGLRLRTRASIEPAARLAWTRRGDRLIVGGAGATVIVDAASGAEVERWPRGYTAYACGFEDACVAAATERGYVDLWRFGATRPGEPTARHDGRVHALAFSDDGARIFTAGDDGRVGCWRAATLDAQLWPVGERALDVAWDDAAAALAVATGRGGVVVLDGKSGARRGAVRPPDHATAVAWAGALLAVGTRDGQLATYDARSLEPAQPAAALGIGAVARLAALDGELVVEGAAAVAVVDAASGHERLRWSHGVARDGGTLALHAAQRAFAVAVPAGVAIVDVAAAARAAPPAEVIVLYRRDEAALCAPVLAALSAAGARVRDGGDDGRGVIEAARRGAACVVLYGPRGPWARHDWQLDVLEARGARVVPVILPGGVVPEAQRRFHGAAYVCFHDRVRDDDALARVVRAVLPRRG